MLKADKRLINKNILEKVQEKLEKGYLISSIEQEFKISHKSIKKYFPELHNKCREINKNNKDEEIKNSYIRNNGHVEMVRAECFVTSERVNRIVKKFSLENIKRKRITKYELNENYFEKIDTEDKAYFLGFLYADGNVDKERNYIQLGLSEVDEYIVKELGNRIYKNKDYHLVRSHHPPREPISRLDICNSKIGKDLIEKGCYPQKSLTLKFPTLEQVPEFLMSHFLRGFWDGDGTFVRRKNIMGMSFGFTSSEFFCKSACDYLNKKNIVNSYHFTPGGSNKSYTVWGSKTLSLIKLYNFLYKNATIFLTRKKNKIENFIKELINSFYNKELSYKGQVFIKTFDRWICLFPFDSKEIYIGRYLDKNDAITAYNLKAQEYKNKLTRKEQEIINIIKDSGLQIPGLMVL